MREVIRSLSVVQWQSLSVFSNTIFKIERDIALFTNETLLSLRSKVEAISGLFLFGLLLFSSAKGTLASVFQLIIIYAIVLSTQTQHQCP